MDRKQTSSLVLEPADPVGKIPAECSDEVFGEAGMSPAKSRGCHRPQDALHTSNKAPCATAYIGNETDRAHR